MSRRRALIEETAVAAVVLTVLSALIDAIFWFSTGRSPWPVLIVAECVTFGWGLILVVITSPSWSRG